MPTKTFHPALALWAHPPTGCAHRLRQARNPAPPPDLPDNLEAGWN